MRERRDERDKRVERKNPTTKGGVQSGSSVGICTHCIHVFFARSAPIRMLSWCILTKISVSELSLLRVSCWLGNLVGEERPDIN